MNQSTGWLNRILLAALTVVVTTGLANAQTPPLRIMPLGDSITYGSGGTANLGGYRGTLYTALTAAGYNPDFIGSQTANSSLMADQNHEGHGGWRIDQLDASMTGWLGSMADPDVVLMHIGTNDFGQSLDTPDAINRLDALILKIATLRPYAHIIVTNLMTRGEPTNTTIEAEFNPYVQERVQAHATAGRRVTFLDMRAAVPLSDMPDNLHPNQTGYDKMAAAWLPAIQAVVGIDGDTLPPSIYRAVGNPDLTHVAITFSKPIADASAAPGNFTLSGGLTVSAATLDASKRVITLTTSPQAYTTSYTATVNGVVDRTVGALALPANTTVNFFGATPRGYLNNVPESKVYTLVHSLEVPAVANFGLNAVPYSVDNRLAIGPFNRIAYYLELQQAGGDLQYLWVSMDPFTTDANQLGVPTRATGATFQQSVNNLHVVTNVPGVTAGSGITGNLEFWPTNYDATNSAGIPGASETTYDFGDNPSAGPYGSMQVHHPAAGQTLFAFNNWGGTTTTGNTDFGIGNQPGGNPDWTFSNNSGNFTVKTIQVLVRTVGDTTPPVMTAATATPGRTKVMVTLSEPVAAASLQALNFGLDQGVTVLTATLASNQREVVLTTTPQPAGTPLTLTASGLRDTSPAANRMAANSTIAVAPAALPPEVIANVGAAVAGYELVYSIDLPITGNLNALGAAAYKFDDSAATSPFSRVAYYLELQKIGQPVQYVWAAMDAFTASRAKTGIPTLATGAIYQRNVTNLTVQSNVAGIVNGPTATGGNLEFWPNSYSVANGVTVPNASATTYDTGDTRTTTATTGYGCMQVHNHDNGANQTVFAVNRFGQDGAILDVGIGNNPAPTSNGVDWTFSSNAAAHSRRTLHVMVLPVVTTDPAVVANVPEAANYQLVYSVNLPATGNLVSGTGFTNYTVNNGAEVPSFSRVAYYMELQKTGDAIPRFVWVSMDAFTQIGTRIGIPTPASGAIFQQKVTNLNIASNVAGVVTGTGITTGNLEFWPTDYSQANAANVLGASTATWDFGDTRSATGTHGSMQVHNYGAAQTLFAINGWGAANGTGALTMGIGNNPTAGESPDYTLSATSNGASWNLRRVLHVYVLPGNPDLTGPAIVRAVGSTTLDRLVITFDEPVAATAAVPQNFSIPGLTVTGAAILANPREIALTTSAQTPGTVYTVTVSNIRDRATLGNLSAPGAATTFTSYTSPTLLSGIPEAAGYELIYRLAIPAASPQWNVNVIPYNIDEAKYGERQFDRVAYALELDGNWVFASFDRHTNQLAKIGVPTLGVTATPFQQLVTHLTVASNVASITKGADIATGNIEYWGGNYNGANGLSIPGANTTTFDFGDTMTSGGHGCLQIHNYGAGQVVLAYNNWGNNSGQTSDTGIGNYPSPSATASGAQLDWTFSSSASASTVRNLYVLARPGGTPTGTAPVIHGQPCPQTVDAGSNASFAVFATGASAYQWRKNGFPIAGATQPWLDLSAVTTNDAGNYDVILSGPTLATTTSLVAALSLNTNAAPTFPGYVLTTLKDTAAAVAGTVVAARASDPTAGPVSVTGVGAASSSGGTANFTTGTIHYQPRVGFTGVDTFPVTLSDTLGLSTTGVITVLVSATGQPPESTMLTFQPGGSLAGIFIAPANQSYQVQRSTDLLVWSTLLTLVSASDGTVPFTDPSPPTGKSFYRLQPSGVSPR